jgi:hypothetical protein
MRFAAFLARQYAFASSFLRVNEGRIWGTLIALKNL